MKTALILIRMDVHVHAMISFLDFVQLIVAAPVKREDVEKRIISFG